MVRTEDHTVFRSYLESDVGWSKDDPQIESNAQKFRASIVEMSIFHFHVHSFVFKHGLDPAYYLGAVLI